jgi:hypothetical protein
MAGRPDDIRKGEIITADWLNRAKNAALSALRVGPGLTLNVSGGRATVGLAKRDGPRPNSLASFARITGAGSSAGKFTAVQVTTEWSAPSYTPTGRFYDGSDLPELTEADGFPAYTGDMVVQVFAGGETNEGVSTPRPIFFHPIGIGTAFDVLATSDGGSAGDNDDPASWTYTLKTFKNHELATEIDPTADGYFQRPSIGYRTAAKVAQIMYREPNPELDGFVVVGCNEIDEAEECS